MKPWKPVAWALVAGVLFGVWLADRSRVLTRDRAAVEAGRLVPFDFLEATAIELRNSEGTIVLEKRTDGSWWILEPVETEADENQVRVLVDNFHGAKKSGTFATADFAGYGLDNPSTTVRLRGTRDGRAQDVTVMLADSSNRAGFVYGAVAGVDEVFTVGDWVRVQAMMGVNDLRNRRLMRMAPEAITRIGVQNPTTAFLIERDRSQIEGWRLRPSDQPAHKFLVDRAVSVLSLANVITLMDEDTAPPESETGLDEPSIHLMFEDADGQRETIEIGAKLPQDDRFYLRSSSFTGVGIVRSSIVADWFQPMDSFGSRQVIWMPRADWIFIESQSLSSRMQIDRDDANSDWRFVDIPQLEIHPLRLEMFLENVENFQARDFQARDLSPEEEVSRFGIRPETYSLMVVSEDGRTEGFRMGSLVAGEGYAYMKRLQDNTIWTVDAAMVHHVTAFRADLQDKRILSAFDRPVARVVLTLAESGRTFELALRNNVWRVRVPGGQTGIVPANSVRDFLASVEELEWDSIAVMTTEPETEFTMEFYDEAGVVMYSLSEVRGGDGESTSVRTPEGVFEVTPGTWRMMNALWVALLESARVEPANQ